MDEEIGNFRERSKESLPLLKWQRQKEGCESHPCRLGPALGKRKMT